MKKINGFSITRLTITGFKCYKYTTSFDFGDTTFITASNGQGKSSIADALAFAFVGTPFFGGKGLDRLQNKFAQEMTVSVDFADDNGENHTLTRSRKRDTTSITYDGITVKQSDLNEAFGGKDVFLSILNPLYFIDVLGDSGKSLLEKLLPTVKHEDVLKRLINEAIQYMAKRIELMLDGLKMSSTEIVLTEIIKTTGEIKDCFRFSYEGRDYKCLSLSEKVRAGLDVAVLIQKLSGRNYPIFVDNGESICTFGKVKPEGQVIIARVVNNQALQVTYKNRELRKVA